jgi:hypothetical protein
MLVPLSVHFKQITVSITKVNASGLQNEFNPPLPNSSTFTVLQSLLLCKPNEYFVATENEVFVAAKNHMHTQHKNINPIFL